MTRQLRRRQQWIADWQALRGRHSIYSDEQITEELAALGEDITELSAQLRVTGNPARE